MWKYLLLCYVMLGWAFFELSGGQDFEPASATSVSEVVAPTDDAEPIDRSFDREEVARAATNALRSIEFDDHAEAAAPVNVVTDAALWKVSTDAETSAIIEKFFGCCGDCCSSSTKRLKSLRFFAQSGEYAQWAKHAQRCHCQVRARDRGSVVVQFIWIMGEITRRGNKSGWLDFQKTVEKS